MDNPEVYFRSKLINPYNDDKGLIETSKEFIQDLLDYGVEITKVSITKGPPQSSVTVHWVFDKRKVNLGKDYMHIEY